MSMYRFSKSGRLFVQGTRENDDRDNVAGSNPTGNSATDLQAIYTKRRLSTEVLGTILDSISVFFCHRKDSMGFKNWGILKSPEFTFSFVMNEWNE